VPILLKIDQEMRPWECSQTDRHTHRHTHRHTDANRFYNLSHAISNQIKSIYAIAMGQIKNLTALKRLLRSTSATRRSKTANIKKDDITSQHSDILAMCCKVISSFCDICCFRSASGRRSSL